MAALIILHRHSLRLWAHLSQSMLMAQAAMEMCQALVWLPNTVLQPLALAVNQLKPGLLADS